MRSNGFASLWAAAPLALFVLHQEPVRLPSGESPARIRVVEPVYPPEAERAWVQGVVVLDIVIDTNGKVDGVKVLRSIPLLDPAAIEAVRQWEYEPTLRGSSPVPVEVTVSVQFQQPGGDEWLVHPEGPSRLELQDYGLQIRADRSREYWGRVRNVSDAAISDVKAIVSYLGTGSGSGDGAGPPAGVSPPQKLTHTLPEYPREARDGRIEGLVILEAPINELGHTGYARVRRSIPALDPAAIRAVQLWEYEPARRDGIPVPALLLASFTFRPREVTLQEAIASEVGRFVSEPIGRLEPGESREFEIVLPAPEGERREVIQLRFVSGEGDSAVELSTSRQRKSLAR